ncbi:MAG: hypothetical protein V7761_07080, partial [Amylibacter sp.]
IGYDPSVSLRQIGNDGYFLGRVPEKTNQTTENQRIPKTELTISPAMLKGLQIAYARDFEIYDTIGS